MFIGLKNIDRIAEGMFFIFIFFFYRANIIDFHPLEELNHRWKQNFLKHRNTRIVQGLTIDRAKTWRGNYAIIKDEDLKINRPIKRADIDSFFIKAKVLSELEFKTVV